MSKKTASEMNVFYNLNSIAFQAENLQMIAQSVQYLHPILAQDLTEIANTIHSLALQAKQHSHLSVAADADQNKKFMQHMLKTVINSCGETK